MSPFWDYLWPSIAAGLLVGVITGIIAFRRSMVRKKRALGAGFAAAIILSLVWHGPMGGADRFAASVERIVRQALVYYEMTQVSAHLHHGPLTRQILLSGQADDFQRSELVRLLDQAPGVSEATWSSGRGGVPLIAQGVAAAVLGFLSGLLLAYLVELRRRYNAQWNW